MILLMKRAGSFQYHYSTGYQKYGVDDAPIQEDAMLMLASQTKLLTSIAALQVVEQGFIGLDDDVSKHIPEISQYGIIEGFDENDKPIIKKNEKPPTLRHLLTHSAGTVIPLISPDVVKYLTQQGKWSKWMENAPKILERFDTPMIYEPGESWMYSVGLDWAGLLIHRLTGLDLEGWMQKHTFPPLGIKGITFWPYKNAAFKDKVPQLSVRGPDGKLIPNTADHLNTHSTDTFGGHGAYAQMSEYIKILHSLLANDGKLLKPATVDSMFEPQLGEGSAVALNAFIQNFGAMLIGEVTPGIPAQHGLGGALWLEDDVGRRKKGTMHWGGMTNPFWMIDREAGLALTFGTQVIPPGDPGCKEMTGVFERAVYKMVGVEK